MRRPFVLFFLVVLFLAACATSSPVAPTIPAAAPPSEVPGAQPPGPVQIAFGADRTTLRPGECAALSWSVEGGFGVALDGRPVERSGQTQVCPGETTTYALAVDAGTHMERGELVIVVEGGVSPSTPAGGAFDPTTLQPFAAGVSRKSLAVFVQKYWDHLRQDTVAQPWLFKP